MQPTILPQNNYAYVPQGIYIASYLPAASLKILAVVSKFWQHIARLALLEKNALNINTQKILLEIEQEAADFVVFKTPLERALGLAQLYDNTQTRVRPALCSSRAFTKITNLLYAATGHEQSFTTVLAIRNRCQWKKALLAFCQSVKRQSSSLARTVEWIQALTPAIQQASSIELQREISEIAFQGAMLSCIKMHFLLGQQSELFSLIIASTPHARLEQETYACSMIRRLARCIHDILKEAALPDKCAKTIALFKSINHASLQKQLAQALCSRFYKIGFISHELPEAWQITAEISDFIDIGYDLSMCTQHLIQKCLEEHPVWLIKQLQTRGAGGQRFSDAVAQSIDRGPHFIQQHITTFHLSPFPLNSETVTEIYQALIDMLLHRDDVDRAVSIVSYMPENALCILLKSHIEAYCESEGRHAIQFSAAPMNLEENLVETASFHSSSGYSL